MNCRICNNKTKKAYTFNNVPKHISVLRTFAYDHNGLDVDLYKCVYCNHYQIEYVNSEDYYDDYLMIPYAESIDPFMERQIKELANMSKNTESFIEIGCGNGVFLNHAK